MFLQPVVDSYVTSEVSVKIVIGGMMVFDNAISIESVVFGAVIQTTLTAPVNGTVVDACIACIKVLQSRYLGNDTPGLYKTNLTNSYSLISLISVNQRKNVTINLDLLLITLSGFPEKRKRSILTSGVAY